MIEPALTPSIEMPVCIYSAFQETKAELKSVLERGLVKSEPHWSEITKHYDRYSANLVDKKSFSQDLFGESRYFKLRPVVFT